MSPRNLRRLYAAGRIKTFRPREGVSTRVLVPRLEIERYLRASVEVSA